MVAVLRPSRPHRVDAKDRLTAWARTNGDNQDWDLSFEGDWNQTDGTIAASGGAFDQSRTHAGTHEILTIDPDNDPNTSNSVTITHDAKGSLTQDNTGLAHTYDFDNLLEQVVVSGSATRGVEGTHTYAYDALGRRVSKTVDTDADNTPDETTVFVCSGQQVLAEYEDATGLGATTPARKYLYSLTGYVDKPLVLVDRSSAGGSAAGTEELIYYFYDGRHNVIGLMNASVQQPERYAYTPYGARLVMTSGHVALASTAYGNHRGFQGLYHDAETGLIYNRARTLDPETGRFLQRDPLGYPDGMNSYAAYHVMWGGVDPMGYKTRRLDLRPAFDGKVSWDFTSGTCSNPSRYMIGLDIMLNVWFFHLDFSLSIDVNITKNNLSKSQCKFLKGKGKLDWDWDWDVTAKKAFVNFELTAGVESLYTVVTAELFFEQDIT